MGNGSHNYTMVNVGEGTGGGMQHHPVKGARRLAGCSM